MKKRILFLIVFLFSGLCSFASEIKPLTVLVIGGGPTGLAAAIEAQIAGADVIVVEKRSSYIRENTLFLYTVTLELFDKWNLQIPLMSELYFKNERRGFVLIKNLEDSLAQKVDELCIKRLHGEFKDFVDGEQAAVIQTADGEISLPYDILVGADGANSQVRQKLNIPCTLLGQAIAGTSMVAATNAEGLIGVDIKQQEGVFAKKITIPFANVILIQSRPGIAIDEMTQKELACFAYEAGWHEDAQLIEEGAILNIENIHVYLQRASAFSDQQKSVILLGDAAGSASFYQGMGANYSLKSAELAGNFFKKFGSEDAYSYFDSNMEKAVDTLIKDSMTLFTD